MDAIKIELSGERQVGLRFDEFPTQLYTDFQKEIAALGEELLDRVEAATPELTGRLRGEERLRVFSDPNRITAYVDIAGEKGSQDFAKAAALEYGAHKATKVKAHTMRLDHVWAEKLNEPMTVLVADYSRTPDIDEVAFERGPLASMQSEAVARLNAVVARATAQANA
jgi:hypothetical protein